MIHALDFGAQDDHTGMCGATGVNTTINTDTATCPKCLRRVIDDLITHHGLREALDEADALIIQGLRDQLAKAEQAADTNIIVEVRRGGHTITVKRTTEPHIYISSAGVSTIHLHGRYGVFVDDVARHPDCDPEDVMRALGNYLHDAT